MLKAIRWAIHSSAGDQAAATGSRLVNFYAVKPLPPEADSKTPVVLYGTPGVQTYITLPPALDGVQAGNPVAADEDQGCFGMIFVDSPAYGKWLVGINGRYQAFWQQLPLGYDPYREVSPSDVIAVPQGNQAIFTREEQYRATQPVRLVTDGRYVMFVTVRQVFVLDIEAVVNDEADKFITIQAPTIDDDGDVVEDVLPPHEWVDCAYVDGYFFLLARSGQLFHSLLNSINFDQLEFTFADTKPDAAVGLAVFSRHLYVFGSESTEIYSNRGGTTFAFRRNREYAPPFGAASAASIQVLETGIYFLAHDGIVYWTVQDRQLRISTESVEKVIRSSDVSKARAVVYTEEGHRFYMLFLPQLDGSPEQCWVYDQTTLTWHERTLTDVLCGTRSGRWNLIGRSGVRAVDAQSLDFGDNDGEFIEREAVSPVLHLAEGRATIYEFILDIPRKLSSEHSILQLVWGANTTLEWGDGTRIEWRGGVGQVSEDRVKLWYTDDQPGSPDERFYQYGDSAGISLDAPRFKWNRMGQFREGRRLRLTTRARRKVDILGAFASIRAGRD